MADGNNLNERFPEGTINSLNSLILGLGELAAQVSEGAGKMTNAIKGKLEDASSVIVDKVTKTLEEEAHARANKESHGIDVETTDKILNGAMNNSRFDIKVSLAEGILNGLFNGSLITVNIHNYAAPQPPASSGQAETEEA